MDWISAFLEYTDGIPSPEIFRKWSGIFAVGAAMERRVWAETANAVLYPNLFVLLVSPPGIGKSQAISPISKLFYAAKNFHVAPDSVTKAALIDSIGEADTKKITKSGALVEYHSLIVPSSEFGVLVPAHDLEFLNVLNHVYDCPGVFREARRHGDHKRVEIVNPQLNILAGTQPGYLASLLPEEAWSMGFTSRLIMVYAGTGPEIDLFPEEIFGAKAVSDKRFKTLTEGLESFSQMLGQVTFVPEAQAELQRWVRTKMSPTPDHSKLVHYNSRRVIHVIKLSIIAAVSERRSLRVELSDVNRARDWLLEAEQFMPDIFREMVKRSDADVLTELHLFAWKIFQKEKRPIHSQRLIHFLSARVPSDKVLRILEIAERANMFTRDTGTELFTPRPRNEHGIE